MQVPDQSRRRLQPFCGLPRPPPATCPIKVPPFCLCNADPLALEEFYCALGLVAEVPPYSDRTDVSAVRWVGQEAADSTGTAGDSPLASPQHKRAKQE